MKPLKWTANSFNFLLDSVIFSHISFFYVVIVPLYYIFCFVLFPTLITNGYFINFPLNPIVINFFLLLSPIILFASILELSHKPKTFLSVVRSLAVSVILVIFIPLIINPCLVIPFLVILISSTKMRVTNKFYTYYRNSRILENFKVILAWYLSIGFFSLGFVLNILGSLASIGLQFQFLQSDRFPLPLKIWTISLVLVIAVMTILFQIHLLSRINSQYAAAKDLSTLEELPSELNELIDSRIERISSTLPDFFQEQVLHCEKKYFIERKNHSAMPSMIVNSGKVNLIFPLGFFKAVLSQPDSADAMLAHELAHYIHKDSNLLLGVRCYMKAANIVIEYLAIIFVLNFIFIFTLMLIKTYLPPAADDAVLGYFRILLGVPVQFVWHLILIWFLYRRVRRAEESADLFASFAVSPDAIKSSLEDFVSKNSALVNNKADSYHPPVRTRIKKIQKLHLLQRVEK